MTITEPKEFETCFTACGGKNQYPSKYPTADHKGETINFYNEAWSQAFHNDLVDGATSLVLLEIADKRLRQEIFHYHQLHP